MLGQRLKRLAHATRDTARERGVAHAIGFAARSVARKAVLVARAGLSAIGLRRVRAEVRRGRAGAPGQPCLALCLTGGVGDAIVIARFMRDLVAAVPGTGFDVFMARPDTAPFAFRDVPGFRHAYHDALFEPLRCEYDLALRANQTVVAYEDGIRWHVLRDAPALVAVLHRLRRSRADVEDFIARHPYRDNYLARSAVFAGASRRNFLHAMAGIPYGGDRLAIEADAAAPDRFGLRGASYVTVHNGFDPDFIIAGPRATKCYPHFGRVVALIRALNPDLVFVQLGTSTSEPIAECDIGLIGRTTLPEAAGLIGGAVAHIDNEGGLVHVAACLGVPAVVLFGPTPSDYFGYPGNINIDPAICGDCWWLTRSWMSHCAKGYAVPRCLFEQKPETVVARAMHLFAPDRMADGPPCDSRAPGDLEGAARTP
jgi:hypothetical protein